MSKSGAQHKLERKQQRQAEQREARAYSAGTIPALSPDEVRALERVEQSVERAKSKVGVNESRQPRFTDDFGAFMSVYRWTKSCLQNEPLANATIQEWDIWRRQFLTREPLLTGVLNSVCQIDTNRGWTITGGRNQVNKYIKILHSLDDGAGWRPHANWAAQAYYLSSMGYVVEVGSQGKGGPLVTLWSVDPCECLLTGVRDAPLRYKGQDWGPDDFFRGASLVSTDETLLGYGYPAMARCYELSKVMVGVWDHYHKKLGTKTPDGVLATNAMDDDQWRVAMEARDQEIRRGEDYLNRLITVCQPGGEVPQFVLTMLSSLPDRWGIKEWTDILMYGYALSFGYDPREFWPVSGGQLGTSTETEVMHRKATSKGDRDFCLSYQEKLQQVLPGTLEFQFEERDAEGEVLDAQLKKAKAEFISEVSRWTVGTAPNVVTALTKDQILQLAVQEGIIPDSWTPQDEDVTVTDEETAPDKSQETPVTIQIARAMDAFPGEPIVRYAWPSNRVETLQIRVRKVFYMPNTIERSVSSVVSVYRKQLEQFVGQAFMGQMDATDLRRAHRALLRELGPQAYDEGLKAGGVGPEEKDGVDATNISNWLDEQLAHVNDFARAILDSRGPGENRAAINSRIDLWVESMRSLGNLGALSAQKNVMQIFDGPDGGESCGTCRSLKGKKHRARWWIEHGLVPGPGNDHFECGGWKCQHTLRPA